MCNVSKDGSVPDAYENETAAAFDEFFDVIVVGYGDAGAIAAIEAHDKGAHVLLIEKMPDPGGISICAGGGLRISNDREAAFTYLKATNGDTTPDDILRIFADGMVDLETYVRSLAKVNDAEIALVEREANYPFPGYRSFGFLEVRDIPGFDAANAYPHARASKGKPIFKLLEDNITSRGIEVRLATAAERLIAGPGKEVRGLQVRQNGVARRIGARRGVVLACGGFEAAPDLQSEFWQLRPVLTAANLSNTGDGIRMAQDLGAKLWHMWHFHGSYGFRHPSPDFPFAIRVKRLPDWTPGTVRKPVQMSWILVDRKGKRFANEYEPYMQDTGHRALDVVDPQTQSYPYIPAFLIVDDDGRQHYPLGHVVYNDRSVEPYAWSKDNLTEVENGILKRADSIEDLAKLIGADPATLAETLALWNGAVEADRDEAFGRPSGTMVPVRRAPFYVGEIWPLVSNTQGGPVHDGRQRVLDSFDQPIPRLYEAGELGSIWGHLYLSGGNLSECFITGRIAGQEAGGNVPWVGHRAADSAATV